MTYQPGTIIDTMSPVQKRAMIGLHAGESPDSLHGAVRKALIHRGLIHPDGRLTNAGYDVSAILAENQ